VANGVPRQPLRSTVIEHPGRWLLRNLV
jgi:hypothetical protein